MTTNKINGIAKWVAIGLVIITHIVILAYNTGVTHNEVKHLKEQIEDVRDEIKELRSYLMSMP